MGVSCAFGAARADPSAGDLEADRLHPLELTRISDLNFGVAPQGDPPKSIPPGNSENGENASFLVTGRPNRAYLVILPVLPIAMHTRGLGLHQTIWVYDFKSYPGWGMNGKLDASGRQMLYIGATRGALSRNQKGGAYRGDFLITVVY